MSRYERAYGTDWETLDHDQAVRRAYALGVAAALGEYHHEELDAIRDQVSTAYDKSIIELAFEEGKNEGREAESEREKETAVWNELVGGIPPEPDEDSTGGSNGLPEAIDTPEALDRPEQDSTDPLELPKFLKRE